MINMHYIYSLMLTGSMKCELSDFNSLKILNTF